MEEKEYNEKKATIKKAKAKNTLDVVKNLGDGITASQGLGYPNRFFGFNFNDGWVGVGGFTSAYISCQTLYAATK